VIFIGSVSSPKQINTLRFLRFCHPTPRIGLFIPPSLTSFLSHTHSSYVWASSWKFSDFFCSFLDFSLFNFFYCLKKGNPIFFRFHNKIRFLTRTKFTGYLRGSHNQSARRVRRTKSNVPKGVPLEVGAQKSRIYMCDDVFFGKISMNITAQLTYYDCSYENCNNCKLEPSGPFLCTWSKRRAFICFEFVINYNL